MRGVIGVPFESPRMIGIAVVGVLALYFVINAWRSRGEGDASAVATGATRRTIGGISATFFGAATVVLVAGLELATFVGQIGDLLATFPDAFGYMAVIAAGVGATATGVGPTVYVGIAVAILVLVAAVKY